MIDNQNYSGSFTDCRIFLICKNLLFYKIMRISTKHSGFPYDKEKTYPQNGF
jgi:hypothetical protein